MGLREDLAADLAAAVGDYDQTFTWSAAAFPCVRTTDPSILRFAAGGEWEHVSERITAALPLTTIDGLMVDAVPEIGDAIEDSGLQVIKIDSNVGSLVLWVGSYYPPPAD